MSINFQTIAVEYPKINKKFISDWITNTVSENNKKIKELVIVFCNDDYIIDLNKKYLKHNYFTDIITFNYSEKDFIAGDLVISVETVESNAKKFKQTFNVELHRVIIHGVLHLLGFNDKTAEQKTVMREKEDYYLSKLSSNP